MNAIFHLGTTARGLLAAAITGDGAALLSAWNGSTSWHVSLGAIFLSAYMLLAALLDPGKTPAKP